MARVGWYYIDAPQLQEDIKELKHGEEMVQQWLETDYKKYEADGLFADADKKE